MKSNKKNQSVTLDSSQQGSHFKEEIPGYREVLPYIRLAYYQVRSKVSKDAPVFSLLAGFKERVPTYHRYARAYQKHESLDLHDQAGDSTAIIVPQTQSSVSVSNIVFCMIIHCACLGVTGAPFQEPLLYSNHSQRVFSSNTLGNKGLSSDSDEEYDFVEDPSNSSDFVGNNKEEETDLQAWVVP